LAGNSRWPAVQGGRCRFWRSKRTRWSCVANGEAGCLGTMRAIRCRADIEAAAQLGLHGAALQLFTLRQQLSELPQPGYVLAILRALDPPGRREVAARCGLPTGERRAR